MTFELRLDDVDLVGRRSCQTGVGPDVRQAGTPGSRRDSGRSESVVCRHATESPRMQQACHPILGWSSSATCTSNTVVLQLDRNTSSSDVMSATSDCRDMNEPSGDAAQTLSSAAVAARRVSVGQLDPVVYAAAPAPPSSLSRSRAAGTSTCSMSLRVPEEVVASMPGSTSDCEAAAPLVFLNVISDTKFSLPNTSSSTQRTRCTFSSPICTKMLPRLGQQLAGDDEPVAQVGEVGVDAELPGVAEGADLLGLAGRVLRLAVLHVALARAHLPVGAELDAVGRVDVDRLDLALQPFLLGEARHHQQRVAQDHPVRPVLVVVVEVDLLVELRSSRPLKSPKSVSSGSGSPAFAVSRRFSMSACGWIFSWM